MSRIYCTSSSKRELINNIKQHNNTQSKLIFIRKYHKYESLFSFILHDLYNIINDYASDVIDVKYTIEINDDILDLNYEYDVIMQGYQIQCSDTLRFNITNNYALIPKLYSNINVFMAVNHGYYNYIPGYCLNNLFTEADKSYVCKIIIIKKIIGYIQKIDNMTL